eukprot:13262276-Ditylum_brightwellii.AAC.1
MKNCFCGGTYFGKTGWKNASRQDTKKRVYVIVDLGNGEEKIGFDDHVAITIPIFDKELNSTIE